MHTRGESATRVSRNERARTRGEFMLEAPSLPFSLFPMSECLLTAAAPVLRERGDARASLLDESALTVGCAHRAPASPDL